MNPEEFSELIKYDKDLKPCPYCDYPLIEDCYVYMRCKNCGLQGPHTNGGYNDDHADFIDRENARKYWNELPRRKGVKYTVGEKNEGKKRVRK
jgi:hypothetical protein